MNNFRRLFMFILALSFANAVMIQTVQAALVSTQEVAQMGTAANQGESAHARLQAVLSRADVQAELERFGVSSQQAQERIAALTDEEAEMLAQQIETAPAGGISALGVLLAVFIILLITDILGLTNIFPFTRGAR